MRRNTAWGVLILLTASCRSAAPPDPPIPAPVSCEPAGERIVFERTGCLGNCPVYRLTLHDSGRVDWNGVAHVETEGAAYTCIPPERVRSLRGSIRSWHAEGGGSEFECEAVTKTADKTTTTFASSDGPSALWRVEEAGGSLEFRRDEGCPTPPPAGLEDLETELHEVAGASRWLDPQPGGA